MVNPIISECSKLKKTNEIQKLAQKLGGKIDPLGIMHEI